MLGEIRVQDCMTSPAITVSATTSVRDAQQLMKEYNIRHLPVVKNNKLVGILSSGDIRRASPSYATSLSVWELQYLWERIRVENVMTQRVITVGPDVTVIAAVRLMLENRFNSLPVVVASGQVVGMLTEVDIFHLLIQESENMSKSLANSQSEIRVAATP